MLFITAVFALFRLSSCMYPKPPGNPGRGQIPIMTPDVALAFLKAVFPEKNFIQLDGNLYEESNGEYFIPLIGTKVEVGTIGPRAPDQRPVEELIETPSEAPSLLDDSVQVGDEKTALQEKLEQHFTKCLRASNPPELGISLISEVFSLDKMAVQRALINVIRQEDDYIRCRTLLSDVKPFIYDTDDFEAELPGQPHGVLSQIFRDLLRGSS